MHSAKYVVATCLCVRPSVFPSVTRWYPIEAVILILNLFSLSGSHAILVFHTKRHCNIPTGTPLTGGGANATGVRQNRDFRPISRFNSEMILWKANRKPHPSFRMVYAISNDLE